MKDSYKQRIYGIYTIGTTRCRHFGLFRKDIRTCNNAHCAASDSAYIAAFVYIRYIYIYYRHDSLPPFWFVLKRH